ncbi:MAG: hypothetical protein IJP49_11195 [Bacteroidales bacterium]|jgi:hypothetical protein|nr:hypothetical protein [Bacteroidales bacterium]
MNKIVKIIVEILLALAAVGLVYAIYSSVMKPVNFNKEKARRQEVAVQRLKDIRTLEVAFKGVNNRFTADIDSLINFYNTGKMDIIMQVGSNDDSLAVENTKRVKDKAFLKLSKEEQNARLMDLYRQGQKLVFSISTPIAVKDTLFNNRPDFCIDSLKYIPFSGKMPVETDAIVKTVSGVQVPLFEARMPWRALLKGMDNQLRINLDAECEAQNKYEGLQVGSVTAPNNNAGNWE